MTLFNVETPALDADAIARPEADRAAMGAVYTPAVLAQWTAQLLAEAAQRPLTRVLDPACGNGALLEAVRLELPSIQTVVGFDLSAAAIAEARAVLGPQKASLYCRDALEASTVAGPVPDAVIMNPPWGADLSGQATRLRENGYSLAAGQFDSWDLFVEWTLRVPSPGTTVAAILPDSVFLPEHVATRRLLLELSQLKVVARLGEGWFDGVFRGVAVVVYTTGVPTTAPVKTIRIDHAARRRVFRGEAALADEARAAAHTVEPRRWLVDSRAAFHATTSAHDSPWAGVLEAAGGPWTNWFHVGRGVEIGASGQLLRCANCGWHRAPSRSVSDCNHCGRRTEWMSVHAVSTEPSRDSVPLVVGRDVRRYQVAASRWLRTGLPGVAYKDPDLYQQPKLLVRKTGLGLNAAVDRSGSHTNQVVFHYVPRVTAPDWVMHYVEGILCSRVMLALHLSRSGETEWRSHPYVTPKVLATLPVPVPSAASALQQAQAIGSEVAALHAMPTTERAETEHRIDELVAGLYMLDGEGCAWVDHVLAQTQTLDAFAHVRTAPPLKTAMA